jgi:hypothetical protein
MIFKNRQAAKIRNYKRFAMKHTNDMLQMDILGPFYISNSSQTNYIISYLDDCSRKVASRWSERKRSVDVLNVLEDWIMTNGKPKMITHDNGNSLHLTYSNAFWSMITSRISKY